MSGLRSNSIAVPIDKAAIWLRSKLPQSRKGSTAIVNGGDLSIVPEVTPSDVLRYRYHHGVNLGSIFVLERWLTPSMFPPKAAARQTSELEAARLWIQSIGLPAARARFEAHWAAALSDADLDWLVGTAHVTSIRLPIGFFTLGPAFCAGTDFAEVSGVYEHAWSYVRNIVQKAHSRGIGVLIDLHALPGGANDGEHSGTNSGKPRLWGHVANIRAATHALEFVINEAKIMPGVLGVQVVNEAAWGAKGMYTWYDKLLSSFARIDSSMPIYISDAWNFEKAIKYAVGKNKFSRELTNPVIIDTHVYWAFSDDDRAKPPQQAINEARTKLKELEGHQGDVCALNSAIAVIVGEYSCVLSEETWSRAGRKTTREELVRQFGHAQSARYQECCAGSFFWTLKMDWMPGGEWGFRAQTDSGIINAPSYMKLSSREVQEGVQKAQISSESAKKASLEAHVWYWSTKEKKKNLEQWRYSKGWQMGFDDAMAFFGMRASGNLGNCGGGGDRIGMMDLWIKKRIIEMGMRGDLWEFEHGFRKGVEDFGKITGAYLPEESI